LSDHQDWVGSSQWYVAPRDAGQRDAWSAELAESGRRGAQRLREVAQVVPPAAVAAALKVSEQGEVVVRRRVMLVEDQPVELTDSYYPCPVAAGTGLARPGKIPGGVPTLLAELGYVAHEVDEELTVRPATADEARELGVPEESLIVHLVRVSSTAEGVPFEVSMMTMRPEGRRFRYRFKVG
jgi:DNA-binding GntR family transcriptional regulator